MGVVERHLKNRKYLYIVLILSIVVGILYIKTWGVVTLSDDEYHYICLYNRPSSTFQKIVNLIPGNLHFAWFFPLNYSVYSFCSTDELEDLYWRKSHLKRRKPYPHEIKKFFRRIGWFNLVLLVLSGLLVYLIGREMGMGDFAAAMATALVTLNFRVVYYILGLWPEIPHYVLMLSGFYFFLLYVRKSRVRHLIGSSFLLTYAAFAKGVVGYYFYILLAILIVLNRKRVFSRNTIIALMVFMLPYFGCITVQKISNYSRYGVYGLTTNIWVNFEAGLIPEEKIQNDGYLHVYDRYFRISDDPVERERLSKKRVVEYLKNTPAADIAMHQISNYLRLLNSNSITRDIGQKRWMGPTRVLQTAGIIAIFLSWFLFVFGIAGVVISFKKNWPSVILAGFLVYYLTALFVIGFNIRFFVQAIPFLAIFTVRCMSSIFQSKPEQRSIRGRE